MGGSLILASARVCHLPHFLWCLTEVPVDCQWLLGLLVACGYPEAHESLLPGPIIASVIATWRCPTVEDAGQQFALARSNTPTSLDPTPHWMTVSPTTVTYFYPPCLYYSVEFYLKFPTKTYFF